MRAFIRYYWRVMRVACTHTLHAAHSLVLLAIVVAGILPLLVPSLRYSIDIDEKAWLLVLVLLVLCVRMVLAPYWIYRDQSSELAAKITTLDRISEDRPLRFLDLGFDVTGNEFHTALPRYDITRVEIRFDNVGERMLKFAVTDVYVEHSGDKVAIQLTDKDSFIHSREELGFSFYIQGLVVRTFPASITIGFRVNYDNVPPLRVRGSRRVVEYRFSSFRPMSSTNRILEQDEW